MHVYFKAMIDGSLEQLGKLHSGNVGQRRRRKIGFIYEENHKFSAMIRCKEVLLRKDWRIINLLRVTDLQEDGPG